MGYLIRVAHSSGGVQILEVDFDQLSYYLETGVRYPAEFWDGSRSIQGPLGDVRIIREI